MEVKSKDRYRCFSSYWVQNENKKLASGPNDQFSQIYIE